MTAGPSFSYGMSTVMGPSLSKVSKMYSGTDSLANLIAVRECCELQGVRDPSGHWHRIASDLETRSAFLCVVMTPSPLDFTGVSSSTLPKSCVECLKPSRNADFLPRE